MRILIEEDTHLSGFKGIIYSSCGRFRLPKALSFAGRSCTLSVRGIQKAGTQARTSTADDITLRLSPAVITRLALPGRRILHVKKNDANWIVGPCVAFYANVTSANHRRFGEQTHMFEDLTTYGNALGVDVVVAAPGYTRNRSVWKFDTGSNEWRIQNNVVADIVIRRSGSFGRAYARIVEEDLARLKAEGRLHTLPRTCSNKWNLYRILSSFSSVRSYLPYTLLASNAEQVYKTLRQCKDVYVKPVAGTQGISIYRLRSDQPGMVRATWEQRLVSRKTEQMSDVFQPETQICEQVLKGVQQFKRFWTQTRFTRCLVQETVLLPSYERNRPFDFRWLVQSSDEPEIVARVARIGQPGAVTTNIHTGGRAVPAEEVISRIDFDRQQTLLNEMDQVAICITKALAYKFGAFAELGIDMAIDRSGAISVLEVNPTPGRRMLRSISSTAREMSLQRLLEYAIRATGFYGA